MESDGVSRLTLFEWATLVAMHAQIRGNPGINAEFAAKKAVEQAKAVVVALSASDASPGAGASNR